MENLKQIENLIPMIKSTIDIIASKSNNIYDFIFSLNHIKGYNVYSIEEHNTFTVQVIFDDKIFYEKQFKVEDIEKIIEGLKER